MPLNMVISTLHFLPDSSPNTPSQLQVIAPPLLLLDMSLSPVNSVHMCIRVGPPTRARVMYQSPSWQRPTSLRNSWICLTNQAFGTLTWTDSWDYLYIEDDEPLGFGEAAIPSKAHTVCKWQSKVSNTSMSQYEASCLSHMFTLMSPSWFYLLLQPHEFIPTNLWPPMLFSPSCRLWGSSVRFKWLRPSHEHLSPAGVHPIKVVFALL